MFLLSKKIEMIHNLNCLGMWILILVELDASAKVGVGVWSSRRAELAVAAAVQVTRRRGDATRSSSPRLLARASVVEARRLGGACVQLDSAPTRAL
jgi:hypothetical protein